MEFEVEVTSVEEAMEQVAAIRQRFGVDAPIKIKIVSGRRERSFELVNDGLQKILAQVNKKIGG